MSMLLARLAHTYSEHIHTPHAWVYRLNHTLRYCHVIEDKRFVANGHGVPRNPEGGGGPGPAHDKGTRTTDEVGMSR